jgi:predicted component of type VI protein secretion system
MIYTEYELCKFKYMELQKRFDAVLTEKERLFTKTQPNAITYDKDHVQMSHDGNVLEDYVIALETGEIDKKIDNLRGLLDDRGKLLRLKEEELRKSQIREDKIYVMRFLEGMNIGEIAKNLNFSRQEIHRKIKNMQIL